MYSGLGMKFDNTKSSIIVYISVLLIIQYLILKLGIPSRGIEYTSVVLLIGYFHSVKESKKLALAIPSGLLLYIIFSLALNYYFTTLMPIPRVSPDFRWSVVFIQLVYINLIISAISIINLFLGSLIGGDEYKLKSRKNVTKFAFVFLIFYPILLGLIHNTGFIRALLLTRNF